MTGSNSSMPCILVIDDNEDILHFLHEILRSSGYHCLTATCGKVGLELLWKESVDLVVLDHEMPEMNGYEVAERIREQWPELPVILYTGLPIDIPPRKQRLFIGIVAKTNCVELLDLSGHYSEDRKAAVYLESVLIGLPPSPPARAVHSVSANEWFAICTTFFLASSASSLQTRMTFVVLAHN